MSLEVLQTSLEYGETEFFGALMEFSNAVTVFFWDGKAPRLGSLSITLPNRTSSQLLGDRDQVLGKIIGELLSSRFNKMALVSTNISHKADIDYGRTFVELTRKLMEKEGNTN